jgi:diguanylate cyclase (GGDEF)-like protein
VAAVLAGLAALGLAFDAARDARALTARSDEVLVQAVALERKVVDLETGLRGYAITRDRVFLRPMMAAQRQIPADLAELRRLARGDAAQERRAEAIETAVWAYARHWLLPALRLHRSDSGLAAQMWAVIGRQRMDDIRTRFTAFESAERALRAQRERRAERFEGAVLALVAAAALAVVAGSIAGLHRFRRRAAQASAGLAAELAAVRARGDELALELERRSLRDPLTGAATRGAFLERLQAECEAARRHGGELSLLVVDVTGLGRINADHGLEAGDRALAALADLARSLVRGADAVGRIGGDELALLLPRTPLRRAEALAATLRRAATVPVAVGVAGAGLRADAAALLADAAPERAPRPAVAA